jgi:hypothetical protein
MSTATDLKTVGYNSLMKGIAVIKAVATAYVNIPFAISDFNKPRHDVVTHTTILSQYGMKKGLRLFGEPGAEAVTKELTAPRQEGNRPEAPRQADRGAAPARAVLLDVPEAQKDR